MQELKNHNNGRR